MKLIHTADLHIGKRVCEHSMLEDQKRILDQIIRIVDEEKPDGVLMAGDVYDKSVPSADAVEVLDEFLVKLSQRNTKVFVLSGNHDSAERIAFGGRLMENRGVHMCPVYNGSFAPVTLKDDAGEVDVWMLPFVRPATVRSCLGAGEQADAEREQVTDYTSAIQKAVSKMERTPGRRNVLVAHQFVTGAQVDEDGSEEFVGGLDNVEAYAFDGFDYVALGHIHRPQNVAKNDAGVGRVRYSGTPLKYSLSEANHEKSVTVVELGAVNADGAADLKIREVPLKPMRDVRKIEGTFAELVSLDFRNAQEREGKSLEDYVYVSLTDENDINDAAAKLRGYYPNLMQLRYNNSRTQSAANLDFENVDQKTPTEIFHDFFKEMNNREMEPEERDFVKDLIDSIWEGNN
ncbi:MULTISPECIES: exonuclease SbcCD subunit D [unclassified Fibrobacter]|uniref:exonuclease SbcCD subunit D n=1 Tax=unclassified Fibrobacter TaxID=2634177 RepID=UPI000D6B09AA|nr:MULTISPECIES: exonuclease SbcCD subunit D [unclassified Fibrobacter]PWJ68279.1 exodeoxyribonuclease I subunit D [Fibrobacter sp. UWR4]PZW65613.1 exodeoxyribonuclease I subunit D [Fibrobacter sp. UWR1]